jgi:hypothetical protein
MEIFEKGYLLLDAACLRELQKTAANREIGLLDYQGAHSVGKPGAFQNAAAQGRRMLGLLG